MRNAKVELIDVALRGCRSKGLYIPRSDSETTVVATRCEFAKSGGSGASVSSTLRGNPYFKCFVKFEAQKQ